MPEGAQRIACYFFNKDGHDGQNRLRDYLLELKGDAPDSAQAAALPTLASARMHDFWGGAYKQFVVVGPGRFWLKVGKENSFNTIVSAVFLDQLQGPPLKQEKLISPWLSLA